MTAAERDLRTALLALENATQRMSTAHEKQDLLPLFARIDELTAALPQDTDTALRHFLQRKSYEKARLFLEGREKENQTGSCRH